MQIIKRKVELLEEKKVDIIKLGFNSSGTLSIFYDDEGQEIMLNINNTELKMLKAFLEKLK